MAAKPLTREEIANTEKKLDMPLDDIIKMSKSSSLKEKTHRAPNKGQILFNNAAKDRTFRVRRYMDSRPFVRQGPLAQRRSNFLGNKFPVTSAVARKAAAAPFRNGLFYQNAMANSNRARARAFPVQRRSTNVLASSKPPQWRRRRQQQQQQQEEDQVGGNAKQKPQTLDALFANMKEQRMKVTSEQNTNAQQRNQNGRRSMVPWARGRRGY